MMGHEHHTGERDGGGGYFVPRPRVTDAVGESLRYAYAETRRVPEEIARILAQLDRPTPQQ